MIKIIEKGLTDISYTIQTIVNDKVIDEYNIKCKSSKIKLSNKSYFILLNRDYNIIHEAFRYLNIFMENKTDQTKELNLVALKYLYSFCEIFKITLKEMDYSYCSKFLNFLYGRSCHGTDFTLIFNTVRSSNSVSLYLSAIRNFIEFLNIKEHPLLRRNINKNITVNIYSQPSYKIAPKTYKRKKVPLYIKVDEFVNMVKKCREDNDLQMECIIRLMFQSGLRIGEVLGLTMEDLIEVNGNCKVILRNRLSDKTFQKAKFLMTITDRNQYNSKDYQVEWYGWNEMAISSDLYDKIIDYIESVHTQLIETQYEDWVSKLKTDSVDDSFHDDNFYIFINKHNSPLSNKTLESKIKELFIKCNIPVNKDGGKYDGLAHRFRHGFAMYQITVNNLDNLLLSKIMRHRSLESVEAYYTPEASETIRIKNNLSESVYDLLPRFTLDE